MLSLVAVYVQWYETAYLYVNQSQSELNKQRIEIFKKRMF